MPFKLIDNAKEVASAGGTGNWTLSGTPVSGFQSFAGKLTSNGDTTMYCARAGTEWESGLLTRVSSTTFSRTVFDNSSGTTSEIAFASAPTVYSTVPGAALNFIGGPAFRAVRSGSNQSITSGTWTKVQLNVETYDYGGNFDSTTNYRFVVPAGGDGMYDFNWLVYAVGSSLTQLGSRLMKNGATDAHCVGYGGFAPPLSTAGMSPGFESLPLVAGDYVELQGYVIGTGPAFSFTTENNVTRLTGRLVRRSE